VPLPPENNPAIPRTSSLLSNIRHTGRSVTFHVTGPVFSGPMQQTALDKKAIGMPTVDIIYLTVFYCYL
jgi:hypothetical protein